MDALEQGLPAARPRRWPADGRSPVRIHRLRGLGGRRRDLVDELPAARGLRRRGAGRVRRRRLPAHPDAARAGGRRRRRRARRTPRAGRAMPPAATASSASPGTRFRLSRKPNLPKLPNLPGRRRAGPDRVQVAGAPSHSGESRCPRTREIEASPTGSWIRIGPGRRRRYAIPVRLSPIRGPAFALSRGRRGWGEHGGGRRREAAEAGAQADRPGPAGRARLCSSSSPSLLARFSWQLPLASDAERALYDMRYDRAVEQVDQDDRIVLVNYDDKTLRALGKRSPLDRKMLADALRTLDAMGPKAIGIDILFDQPQAEDPLLIDHVARRCGLRPCSPSPPTRRTRSRCGYGRRSSCATSSARSRPARSARPASAGADDRGRRDAPLARRSRRACRPARQCDDPGPSRIPHLYAAASIFGCPDRRGAAGLRQARRSSSSR